MSGYHGVDRSVGCLARCSELNFIARFGLLQGRRRIPKYSKQTNTQIDGRTRTCTLMQEISVQPDDIIDSNLQTSGITSYMITRNPFKNSMQKRSIHDQLFDLHQV